MNTNRGFTLVELVMVIMVTGIIAASVTVFLKPAIDSYVDTRHRAEMTDMADTAIRRMSQDIRRAVPNSVRWVSATCFQLVPTIAGGRYRMGPNTTPNPAYPATSTDRYLDPAGCVPSDTCSAPLDTSTGAAAVFDVLSPLAIGTPAKGDHIVINNQNSGDVYTGANRAAITDIIVPTRATDGLHRITAAVPVSVGYDGGRFVAVADAEQTVTYAYVATTTNLYRKVAAFGAANCSAGTSTEVVASKVAGFTFVYDPNEGATQQSGFVWMRLELMSDSGESVALAHGVHVDNVP